MTILEQIIEDFEQFAFTANAGTFKTRNEAWGFFGTISNGGVDAKEAWAIALNLIIDTVDCSGEAAREFLDSRDGRHFADEVRSQLVTTDNLKDAIKQAIDVYQGWTISRRMERLHGIPAGLPYLTGWVGYYEAMINA